MPSDESQKVGKGSQRRRPSRRPMLDMWRTPHPKREPTCVGRKSKLPLHHCVVILETRHIFKDHRQLLVASKNPIGKGERQRQTQMEEKDISMAMGKDT